MLNQKRIYLVGFMASGKSYIGPSLAKALNYSFIDLDDAIVKASGLSSVRANDFFRHKSSYLTRTFMEKSSGTTFVGRDSGQEGFEEVYFITLN